MQVSLVLNKYIEHSDSLILLHPVPSCGVAVWNNSINLDFIANASFFFMNTSWQTGQVMFVFPQWHRENMQTPDPEQPVEPVED